MILGPVPVAALTAAQSAALHHVRQVALRDRPAALAVIAEHLAAAGAAYRYEEVVAAVTGYGRLTLNFHPDRVLRDGRTVAEALDGEGVYRSQFETGISNGGLTAYPGGDRDVWEQAMFGGAYQRPGVLPTERPKYGGLNLLDHADGASPRFGSCHLRLRPEVLVRATFTFGDSHLQPAEVGTVDVFEPVFAALLTATAGTGVALGVAGTDTGTLLRTLLRRRERESGRVGRALDDYVEAQVHGEISLARDVEALVADPSFRDTDMGHRLAGIAGRHGLALRFHSGFVLPADEVDAEFRGPDIPPLALRVAAEFARPGEPLHAALVGRAAASVVREPQRWADRGPAAVTLQHLKQLWHVLVRFGVPA
ncbi:MULTISPECIES: DUF3626 domain-containing protein [unclassified Micromonospora]|uniref:DUF3626 domain-containing protein n=1 Tax=unclassified Micromonospora TaxID=2617518 RepID=UPI001C23AFAC|nr:MULTISPECIES: DUF3626 domain-containing protein [unclassified Micromonospora]MBU8861009.1 DUF3626 domain-containing protein [Micromonospora sp. WMMB482]MDM4780553.1 DUF3626 domain-containing protein [Micromonospora sp. b486]